MSETLIHEVNMLMQSIGWALVHSVWQAWLIWLLVLLVHRALPGISARLKHSIALLGMVLLCVWIATTAIVQWQQFQTVAVHIIPGNATTAGAYIIEVPTSGWMLLHSPFTQQLHAWIPWLMRCYGLGLFLMVVRFSGGLMVVQRLRTRALAPADHNLTQLMETLQQKLGITQRVLLRVSTRVVMPVVIGALRPMIILPETILKDISPDSLEAIILHELAHISRSDYLINIFLSIAESFLFFNPFVWRISSAIRTEREHCCDDLVVSHTEQPLAYARTLAMLARNENVAMPMALGLHGNQHQATLLKRIKRIIEMKVHPPHYGQVIAACTLSAVIIAASIACFSPSHAQNRNRGKKTESSSTSSAGTQRNYSKIVVVDTDGVRHEYTGLNALPPKKRQELNRSLNALNDSLVKMRNIGPEIQRSLADLDKTLSNEVAHTMKEAMANVDWDEIGREVDSAMQEVSSIDWTSIEKEVARGLAEADRALSDPKLRAQIRREMAEARKEIATARRAMAQDHHRSIDEARRSMERSRQQMEEARKEMDEAMKEIERSRKEERE
jgi:bla regulator protein BlaR1